MDRADKIAGYRLEGPIGQGDLAVVHLAHDERLDRQVAIKILAPELTRDAVFRNRLLDRVRAAAEVAHPHILPVYEAGEAGGTVYIVMRYVPGGDARSRLESLRVAQACKVIAQVASALDAAHAHGVIHGDVKPANMLLGAGDRGFDQVCLTDFGMRRVWPPEEMTAAVHLAGTLDYVAPEQIEGRALDGRADEYSLACAGFELLCGTPPFGPDKGLTALYAQLYAAPPAAAARRPGLPASVDRVLGTALAKDPAARYASCGQFAEELRRALGLVPGEPDNPARPRTAGQAGPGPVSRLVSGGPRPGEQPPSRPGQPAPAPGQVSPGPAGGPDPTGEPGPAGGPDPRAAGRRSRVIRLTLAAAAVAAAAAVSIGLARSGGTASRPPAASSPGVSSATVSSPAASSPSAGSAPSSPSASAGASQQAAAVNNVLRSSTATLKALQGAVSEVFNCTNLPGAVRQIQDVVGQRSTEYGQASALSISALANGATVKSDLIAALRGSLDADQDFLTWAQQQLNSGCAPAAQSSAYNAAYDASQQAGVAKEAFIQVWNPIAARYGLQQEPSGTF